MADYLRLQSALGAVTAILAHDRWILLWSLGALMHRVVAGDLEGLVLGRGVLRGGRVLGDDKKFFFPVDALEQLAACRRCRLRVVIGHKEAASRGGRAR